MSLNKRNLNGHACDECNVEGASLLIFFSADIDVVDALQNLCLVCVTHGAQQTDEIQPASNSNTSH